MPTLELGITVVDVPEALVELREQVSDVLALTVNPSDIDNNPKLQQTVDEYAMAISGLWGDVAEQAAEAQFGNNITAVPRVTIVKACGRVIQQAASAESTEITKLIDSNPTLSRRQRFARKLRRFIGPGYDETKNISDNVEGTALGLFCQELARKELGTITEPTDLRHVAERAGLSFVTRNVVKLDERSYIAAA